MDNSGKNFIGLQAEDLGFLFKDKNDEMSNEEKKQKGGGRAAAPM